MIENLPAVNASLNGIAACLLVAGLVAIKQRKIAAHKACMVSAFLVSAAFLACYLTYHFNHPTTLFPGTGLWKIIYLLVLVPHIILAIIMLPMIFRTFWLAHRENWPSHRAVARWTLPIWLYVSITGVVVYWMLYRVQW